LEILRDVTSGGDQSPKHVVFIVYDKKPEGQGIEGVWKQNVRRRL
jgi:hypothetical protein